ncbi:MAG: iron-sulfur cluster assembly scaffold protein [Deltaproteobacteria bacterium]|nr:iron-sulfur cluster assembly scaffold protein [Deltaproteobacteria bacterium]
MAKKDLIGGALWEQYSNKVSQRMDNPTYRGEITNEEARQLGAKLVVADWGAESCGDAVRLYWAVDPETHVIKKAAFKSFGCGTAIASSDMMAELCLGKTVDEAVKITNIDVERALRDSKDIPAVPPQKMHCSVMAYDVIKKAASLYKGVEMSSLEQRDVVCECARVTLGTIKDVIKINNLKTVEEVTQYTKAGAFCKSCIQPGGHEPRKIYLIDILRDTRLEMERESIQKRSESGSFKDLGLIQKLKTIERTLEKNIKPMLLADGGSLEVSDIQEEGGRVKVYIQYMGVCATCPSAKTGTLFAIEQELRKKIDPSLDVVIM